MKQLLTTTALALVLAATGFAGPAAAVDREPGYCGQSWLQVDTNNDGMVTQSEAEAAFATEFSSIDADGDDKISREEYSECRTSGLKSAAKKMNNEGRTSSASGQQDQQAADGKSQFQAMDANKDGRVSAREYSAAARQAYDDAHRQAVSDKSLVKLRRFLVLVPEQGQAGQASGAGSASGQGRKMTRDEAAARSAMKFSALDSDGDGNLTESEWSAQITTTMSPALAESHFTAMDEDDDGVLTRSEYRAARGAAMGQAQEAIQAWDEPQTLSEGQAQGRQGEDEQELQLGTDDRATSSEQLDEESQASVPVFIYRFHAL